jgi:SAM-dependent methyltransferase
VHAVHTRGLPIDPPAPGADRSMRHELEWVTDHRVRLGGVEFHLVTGPQEMHQSESKRNQFLLGKTRLMVEEVAALREREQITRILDVGIFKGGSVALYAQLFQPEQLVAIELADTPEAALTEFIGDHRFEGRVTPCYGVNQADEQAMGAILATHFPAQNIDLIVDDASHQYVETRKTLNLALPYLRPDGLYIIEDWGWAHWRGDEWQKSQFFPAGQPALSNLLIELFMLCASWPEIIQNVLVTRETIVLRRGPAALEPKGFDIGHHYLCRDRCFEPML